MIDMNNPSGKSAEVRRLAPFLTSYADMEALLDDSDDVLQEHLRDDGDAIAVAVGGGL